MMGWPMGPWGAGGWWAGMLAMLAFWIILVGGVVWAVRILSRGVGANGRDQSRALAILEERFARGEISAEEFRRMREELRS